MRQWGEIKRVSKLINSQKLADQFSQGGHLGQELADSQFANRNYESRPQDADFGAQPFAARGYFVLARHTISASGILARKTPADGGHVYGPAKFQLAYPGFQFKPLKHRFPCGPCERSPKQRFLPTRRLPNEHHPADDWPTRDRDGTHLRALPTGRKRLDVRLELSLAVQYELFSPYEYAVCRLPRTACTRFLRLPNMGPYPYQEIRLWI
jgi:hypothetical protein